MIKKQKRTGLICLIAGAVVIAVSIFVSTGAFNDGLLSGVGAALLVIGFARILKLHRLEKHPDKAADYEAAFSDERTAAIGGKAGRYALFITVWAEIAAGIVCAFAFHSEIACQVLCYGACFACLVYYATFVVLNKKM